MCLVLGEKVYREVSPYMCRKKEGESSSRYIVERLKSKTGKNDPTIQAKDIGAKRTP